MRRELAAFGAHLQLIATAQIDAAVTTFWAVHFNMQFEILELFCGHDVGSPVGSLTGYFGIVVHQLAIACYPFVVLDISYRLPTFKIFAVEKSFGFGPLLRHWTIKRRRLHASEHRAAGLAALL